MSNLYDSLPCRISEISKNLKRTPWARRLANASLRPRGPADQNLRLAPAFPHPLRHRVHQHALRAGAGGRPEYNVGVVNVAIDAAIAQHVAWAIEEGIAPVPPVRGCVPPPTRSEMMPPAVSKAPLNERNCVWCSGSTTRPPIPFARPRAAGLTNSFPGVGMQDITRARENVATGNAHELSLSLSTLEGEPWQ